ncbi:MAG TPA: L,D-transpeptidase family protein [Chitinophagaceae bacterium]|nr:L,D-transpeptidase family protein [Chitinophagaceae bacterium]
MIKIIMLLEINVGLYGMWPSGRVSRFIQLSSIFSVLVISSCNTDMPSFPQFNTRKLFQVLDGSQSDAITDSLNRFALDSSQVPGADSAQNRYLKLMYQWHQGKAFWVSDTGCNAFAKKWLLSLEELLYDGLNPESFGKDTLSKQMLALKRKKNNLHGLIHYELAMSLSVLQSAEKLLYGSGAYPQHAKYWKLPNDTALQVHKLVYNELCKGDSATLLKSFRPDHPYYQSYLQEYKQWYPYRDSVFPVLLPVQDSLHTGDTFSWVQGLRKRLHFLIPGNNIDSAGSRWDASIEKALSDFQFLNGIRRTARPDSTTMSLLNRSLADRMEQVAINMERMRMMPHHFRQPYIWVDVPRMELDYRDHNQTEFTMRVVVGRPSRPTTMLCARLKNIVFSPPWTVPPTIMREEVIPGIARRGVSYLKRKGLRVYDRSGHVVPASQINLATIKRYSIGQSPGYRSSLGEVKFNLPNPWSIYLHDTPHRDDFVKFYRAYSSGCIRVHHPKEFAAFLLADSTKYSLSKIDSICKRRKTMYVPYEKMLDVYIVYLTNTPDSAGRMIYHRDIYHWDALSRKTATEPVLTQVGTTEMKGQQLQYRTD